TIKGLAVNNYLTIFTLPFLYDLKRNIIIYRTVRHCRRFCLSRFIKLVLLCRRILIIKVVLVATLSAALVITALLVISLLTIVILATLVLVLTSKTAALIAIAALVLILIRALSATKAAAIITTASRTIEHLHLLSTNLGNITVLAVRILVFTRTQATFDINLTAFTQILCCDFA